MWGAGDGAVLTCSCPTGWPTPPHKLSTVKCLTLCNFYVKHVIHVIMTSHSFCGCCRVANFFGRLRLRKSKVLEPNPDPAKSVQLHAIQWYSAFQAALVSDIKSCRLKKFIIENTHLTLSKSAPGALKFEISNTHFWIIFIYKLKKVQ